MHYIIDLGKKKIENERIIPEPGGVCFDETHLFYF
jgi:hypothetical protein